MTSSALCGVPGWHAPRPSRGAVTAQPAPGPIFLLAWASGEGRVKRQWRIRRELIAVRDGHQRWDRTYQYLLNWAASGSPGAPPPARGPWAAEVEHAGSDLRAGLDAAPGAGTDDRAATRTVAGPCRGTGVEPVR